MNWRSKVIEGARVLLIVVLCGIGLAAGLGIARVKWDTDSSHKERCRKWRREFFDECLATDPRYRCEVQWARLDGKVFDAPPNMPWADQMDCSEVK